jgi:hypothetical protein
MDPSPFTRDRARRIQLEYFRLHMLSGSYEEARTRSRDLTVLRDLNNRCKPTSRTVLDTLPTEIVQQITSSLDKADLLSVRLVNQRLASTTLQQFAEIGFRTVTTELSSNNRSRRRLQKIVQNDTFRSCVRVWRVQPCLKHTSKLFSKIVDKMLESGNKLTNCSSLELSTSPSRVHWIMDDEDIILVISALQTLARIVSRTSLTLHSVVIDIGIRQIGPGPVGPDMPLNMSPYQLSLPHIRSLSLRWCLPPGELFQRTSDFIAAATNLEELSLDLQWIYGSTPFYVYLAGLERLPPIRHLVIHERGLSFRTLADRLRKTLVSIKILRVDIEDAEWIKTVQMVQSICPHIESIASDNPPRRARPHTDDMSLWCKSGSQ